ncbi:MAG: hypothetical protein QOH76_3493 [Thermoleophilaceae bacterium]|jgi:hypothetical protein|nr:hypothetical protein [Thermoleophilaceae bacterium]
MSWTQVDEQLDWSDTVKDGTIESPRGVIRTPRMTNVVAISCDAEKRQSRQLRLNVRGQIGITVSRSDFAALAAMGDTSRFFVRTLTAGERTTRIARSAALPVVSVIAALAAALALLVPGPSENAQRQRALSDALTPVAAALRSLEALPRQVVGQATAASRAIAAAHAQAGGRPAARRELRRAGVFVGGIAGRAAASMERAQIVSSWHREALRRGASSDTRFNDAMKIIAAAAALAAAVLSSWALYKASDS